MMHIIYI